MEDDADESVLTYLRRIDEKIEIMTGKLEAFLATPPALEVLVAPEQRSPIE